MVDPAHAYPITSTESRATATECRDRRDHLVAGNDRQTGRRCSALDFIEFGMADTAGMHLEQQFTAARLRYSGFHLRQRLSFLVEVVQFLDLPGAHILSPCRHTPSIIRRLYDTPAELMPASTEAKAADNSTSDLLNSERILKRYGTYHVDVLWSGDNIRQSVLSSLEDGERICRTYAVTWFTPSSERLGELVRDRIAGGASLGETLKKAGYRVLKKTIHVGDVRIDDDSHPAVARMRISTSDNLALHLYRLCVLGDDGATTLATIAEIHHPDFLTTDELQQEAQPDGSDETTPEAIEALIARITSAGPLAPL